MNMILTSALFCSVYFLAIYNVPEIKNLLLENVNQTSNNQTQNILNRTGSDLSPEDALKALELHNMARKEVGNESLEWSVELSEYAQEWANYLAKKYNCEIAHRSWLDKADKNYGENLFWGTGKSYSAADATEAWYSEKKDYSYQTVKRENFFATGHYTQMIWKTTQRVGMGIAICENGATIIVANYEPVGNILGEKPY